MARPFRVEYPGLFDNGAFLAKCSEKCEISQLAELKPKESADQIVLAMCDEPGCKTDMMLGKVRKKNVTRDTAIYLSRDFTEKSVVAFEKKFRKDIRCRHYGQVQSLDKTNSAQQQVETAVKVA